MKDDSEVRRRKDGVKEWSKGSLIAVTGLISILLASFIALTLNMPKSKCSRKPYNTSLLGEVKVLNDGSHEYSIVVVTDLDTNSKHPTKSYMWQSYMRRGKLFITKDFSRAEVQWNHSKEVSLTSTLSVGGRSMELSDLTVFDGKLLSIDDRTGIIYRIDGETAYPWVLVGDGPGTIAKGFKGEWLTVKGNELWVGGLGKEWTTTEGVYVNDNPMWVKRVSYMGNVEHVNWVNAFKKLRSAVGIEWPGYMIHESAQWSDVFNRWFFMPRRASKLMYTEVDDENRGTNYLLIAHEDFSKVKVKQIGRQIGSRGYSAFQFVPGTNDQIIVALKSEEKDAKAVASYITVFNHETGQVLLEEQPLAGKYKYEGIAFV